jgi:hypothetical protein
LVVDFHYLRRTLFRDGRKKIRPSGAVSESLFPTATAFPSVATADGPPILVLYPDALGSALVWHSAHTPKKSSRCRVT